MAIVKLFRPVRREIGDTGLVVQLAPEGVYMREKGERGWLGPYAYGPLFLRCAEVSADVRREMRVTRRRRPRLATRGLLATERGRARG